MMTTILEPSVLELNALADAAEIARDLKTRFIIEDLKGFDDLGINLHRAARAFCSQPLAVKNNRLIKKLSQEVLNRGRDLSDHETLVVINIMREHLLQLKPTPLKKWAEELPELEDLLGRLECHQCGDRFDDRMELLRHKMDNHEWKPDRGTMDQALLDPESVVKDKPQTGVDLSELHDGFYAVADHKPDTASSGGWRFIRVRRARTNHLRNKGYVYGKVIKGGEIVPVGTIEVRNVIGDTKELHGEQQPGHLYQGDHAELLEQLVPIQELAAEAYAMVRERCGICGKGLTDEISRMDLMGPVCVAKYPDYWTSDPEKYLASLDKDEAKEDERLDSHRH